MINKIDIFISYAHGDNISEEGKKRQVVLDVIQQAALEKPFVSKVYIDIKDISYKGSIKNFAQDIGKAKYIIIILSDKFLKSVYCMREVSQMLEYPDFRDRIFPVVLEDARIYNPEGKANYTLYWQEEVKKLDILVNKIEDPRMKIAHLNERDELIKINQVVSNFTDLVGYMNYLEADIHIKNKFETLFEAIEAQQKTIRAEKVLEKVLEENSNLIKDKEKITKECEALKKEKMETKKAYIKYESDKSNQIKLYEKQIVSIKKEFEDKIKTLDLELENLTKDLSNSESDRVILLEKVKKYNEEKQERKKNLEEQILKDKKEKQKRLDAIMKESEPYNVLKIEKGVSAVEIEKQYSKLKYEFLEGIKNDSGYMKIIYEKELEALEQAYENIYLTVKEKEDKAIKEAYSFLKLKANATSEKIKQKYDELLNELTLALNSDNKNVVNAAKENIENLKFHYKYLYSLVKRNEDEEIELVEKIIPKNMVFVKGGKFLMGNKEISQNDLFHEVEVYSFFIDKYPLRVQEFRLFCETHKISMPEPPPWGWEDNHPMVNISWNEASIYAAWIGKRLPSEAEWEFAARGGIQNKSFIYAGSNDIDEIGWYNINSKSTSNPVGLKKPNELGIFDMSGNVWEWCNDWYDKDYYKDSPVLNPKGPETGKAKVLRGGSYKVTKDYCKTDKRLFNYPYNFNQSWGVRFVKDF